MFSLMLHKLMHKKWMVLCLLIGNILLISVAASYPMYRVSSFQKMLMDEFENYIEEENCWPSIFSVKYSTLKGGGKIGFSTMEQEAGNAIEQLDVEMMDTVVAYHLGTQRATPAVVRDDETSKRLTLAAITNMNEHVEIVYGRYPSEEVDEEGFIEIMVSDEAMVEQDVLLDDEYTFDMWATPDGIPIKMKVVGVFRPLDESELYWEPVSDDLVKQVYTTEKVFRSAFLGENIENLYSLYGEWHYIWDYQKLDISDVSGLLYRMDRLDKVEVLDERMEDSGYMQILEGYSSKAKRIEATLLILQVPVLLLLCAFLYMIAGQMLQMERNEISLMRSRGASKRQVFLLYLMQSIFLSAVSVLGGIPLGAVFCKLLGASTAFLEFSATRSLEIRFTGDVLLYAAGAVLLSVIMTTIPVLSYSGLSIVNLKQSRSRQKKSFWKRMYLDVILLAISLYGFYSFQRSSAQMMEDVLVGNSLDPLLYISFSLFVFGAGLFCARIQPILLKGAFGLFKNHMKPSTYTSVLSTIRTGAKQEFIIVFLILTVSIGISDTTIARTIVLNAVNNTRHMTGADIVLQEKWENNQASVIRDSSIRLTYIEPDFNKYNTIPGVEKVAQVIVDEKAVATGDIPVTVMGIKAQSFYDVTVMDEDLLPYSYVDYLNVLSSDAQAVIVSENFMINQGYKLGDMITYENGDGVRAMGFIYGFFNYWPSYEPESYSLNEEGGMQIIDEYMIVANFTYLRDKWGTYPYEIWMDVSDESEGFYTWLEEQSTLKLTKLEDMTVKESDIIQDTMFQGTNGILSMSFIVILLLCCVGYLIYWIMSIRSRELLFGVLRAMGMRKKEITWILVIEQICCGLYAILAGAGIGVLASQMFVPMIQQAYAAAEQILPLKLITQTGDMVQLFAVIGLMLCVCLIVLGRIISKMNISSALKLGED
uniref:FtsX-like permease family protein n=1 Tax=Acetatifactor sp. TaxID=1872090 RepID=UPI004057179C